jgi:hypothetical protein
VGSCCIHWLEVLDRNAGTGANTWKYWTPIQPYYSKRGIALHQHPDVTGHPIGHGCVRMAEDNARRIAEFSNGTRTNVTIDGAAARLIVRRPVNAPAARPVGLREAERA